MSVEFYRVLHVVGALVLFLGLGGVLAAPSEQKPSAVWMILHGVGLLVMVVAGLGTVHRGAIDWSNWLSAKLACWVFIGAVPTMVRKGLLPRFLAMLLVIALGATAVWLAQTKPF